MSGIYIHVPFCKQACHYCNFHFSTQTNEVENYVDALITEMDLQKNYLSGGIQTLYFGGGTPSLLASKHFDKIFNSINKNFNLSGLKEITIETNPDDLTDEYLSKLKSFPFNRLSIGVQSFDDKHLKMMNRVHDAAQSISSVKMAQQKGYDNISIDLMYGLPELSVEEWNENLEKAAKLNVQHLSCYSLTLEERTALAAMVKQQKIIIPEEGIPLEQMTSLMSWASQNGFEHYEISNLSKPGFRSNHNSNYWKGTRYLGLGPSAHSFNGSTRQWNVSNNHQYIKSLQNKQLDFDIESLTPAQQYSEYVMTNLRTVWGVDLNIIEEKFGTTFRNYFSEEVIPYKEKKLIEQTDKIFTLTAEGKFISDQITSDLFFVTE